MEILLSQQPKFLIDIESMLALPASVFWKDIRGVYLGCNDVMAELGSMSSRSAIIGVDDVTLLGATVAKQFVDHDRQVIQSIKPLVVTEYFRNQKGTLIKGLTTKAPLFDDKGNLMGLWGISFLQDMSPQEEQLCTIQITQHDAQAKVPGGQKLSRREMQCLQRVAKGLSAKAIANELDLSVRTVESYIESVKSKLGCINKSELILKAIKGQYITTDLV